MMNEEAECAVCHQPIPKGRVHYGGVSCYFWCAFFRRNTVRSFQYAKEKDNAASLTWTGSSALIADTINASGLYKQL